MNAVTADASAQELSTKFQFQYIPTSFFLSPDGQVLDSYTGPMTAQEMRLRLDKLVGAK